MSSKRANLYSVAQACESALEIGFNAGHSALIMLTANPAISTVLEVFFCFARAAVRGAPIGAHARKLRVAHVM